jgi:hypothetical protein
LGATSAIKLDFGTLTDKSARIVIAKAGKSEARWDAGRTAIWTHFDVTVSETLKGDAVKDMQVSIRGGVVGNIGQNVSGGGNLEKDKEYLLFLWKDDAGLWRLQGMIQGAFAIETRDGVPYAKNSLTGLTILDPTTLKPNGDQAATELKLSDARARIKARPEEIKAAKATAEAGK